MASGCGVAIEDIDLSNVGRDGLEGFGVCDALGGEAFSAIMYGGGDATEEGRVAVCGGAENVAVVIEAKSPGVVVELVEEFDLGKVLGEAVDAHAEAGVFGAKARVSHGSPDAVVEPIAEVGGPGVGVIGAPAAEEDFLFIGNVITVGVLQEKGVRCLVENDATVREGEGGGDVELVGEDGDFVAFAVAIGVFKNLERIIARVFAAHFIGVVDGLENPEAAAVVPLHPDGINDVRFGGEKFEFPAHGDLGVGRLSAGERGSWKGRGSGRFS